MRANPLRKIWAKGGHVVNGWLAIPSAFSAETMAHQGWDSLTVDLQHGVVDYQAAATMFAGISTTDTVPMARVPWLDPAYLMKVLDAGAYGVICPMVSSVEDAENLVKYTRYPPMGGRSFGPVRAALYGGADYPQHANDEIVVLAMIETRGGLDNLDAILAVDGLDGVYVGPSDLSLALGCRPVFEGVDPPVQDAIEHVAARARAAGKVAGIHCGTPGGAKGRIALGYQFVTISSDQRLMIAGSQEILTEMRSNAPKAANSGY